MSDNIPPSIYAGCPYDRFTDRFRRLLMHLFLDDLSLGQVEKVFFICRMPQRLKDDERAQKFRFEVLTYVEQQLLDEWIQSPNILQNILEEVGRTDMSKKVQELVAGFPQEQMFQTHTIPPVQEMETVTPSMGDGDRDFCGCTDKSSTYEAKREPQPQAVSLQSLRFPGKHTQEYMEKIPEENSMSHNEERCDSLKRSSSTASEARSSGYFSNPRGSELRFSQLSITESGVEQAEKGRTLLTSIKQTNCEEDEGLMMEIDQTHEFVNSLEKDENAVGQNGTTETNFFTQNNNGEEIEFRPRCYQLTVSPSHVRSPFKVNGSELQPQNRIRSKSLPNSSRHLHNVALHSTISPPFPSSNSSCTSLDSETTNGSPSEASSFAGSQLSLASANSDSKPNSLRRRLSPPNQKPYPVDSQVHISGSMELKVKNILKSIEKKDQTPLTSEKFPSFSGHRGPYYEIRFIPSDFSKKSASLYVDVAQSYLRKKAKSKNHSAVEIPAINITVSLAYLSESTGNSISDKREIKSVSIQTEKKKIESHTELQKKVTVVVASFPQLVSHAELNLSESEGRSLVILVNMCYQ